MALLIQSTLGWGMTLIVGQILRVCYAGGTLVPLPLWQMRLCKRAGSGYAGRGSARLLQPQERLHRGQEGGGVKWSGWNRWPPFVPVLLFQLGTSLKADAAPLPSQPRVGGLWELCRAEAQTHLFPLTEATTEATIQDASEGVHSWSSVLRASQSGCPSPLEAGL